MVPLPTIDQLYVAIPAGPPCVFVERGQNGPLFEMLHSGSGFTVNVPVADFWHSVIPLVTVTV
jgi:hypothetical protein